MSKSILFVTGIYPPEIGGPATYIYNIAPEFEKKGYKIHIITLGDRKSTSNITYISKKYNFLKRHLILKKFVEKNEFDIVYVQDPFSFGFGVALAKTKSKKIMKIVGDNVWEISRESLGIKDTIDEFQKKIYFPKIYLMKKIQTYSAKRMDKIIVPSKYLKKIVSGWGIRKEKITVIYNAIKDIDLNEHIILKEFKGKNEKKRYLTVARLAPWKGVELLVEIFKERKDELVIVGDGPLYDKLISKSKDYKNIKLLGRQPKDQVYDQMKKADVFILNSGYEGLPHVVIESFKVGTPVLLSNVCGNPEIVIDDYNGKLFKYDDKESIIKAMDSIDKNSSKKYVLNAHKSLEKFEWNNMLNQLFVEIEK